VEMVGRYELIEEIGQGGMGVVYCARDTMLQREVALKLLPAYLSQEESFNQRFQQEAQVIAQLEHPHIVPVYDVGEHEGRPFLVMRLLKGGTLRQRLAAGSMTTEGFLRVVHQVAKALDTAHRQGILHRDVKPSNILFDEEGTAFVADFGVAKVLDATTDLTGSGVVGTPTYMSPEHFTGKKLDGRSDQYSLAVVIYEALTGELPFTGKTIQQLIYQHLEIPPREAHRVNATLPAALSLVLAQALAKQPDGRFNSNGAFARALERALLTPVQTSSLPETKVVPPPLPPAKTAEADSKTTAAQKLQRVYGQGLQALADKDWEAAVNAFAQVLAMEPNHPKARSRYKEAQYYLAKSGKDVKARAIRSPVPARAPKAQLSEASPKKIIDQAGGSEQTGHEYRTWLPFAALVLLFVGMIMIWFMWPQQEVELVVVDVTATWTPESGSPQPTGSDGNEVVEEDEILVLEPAGIAGRLQFDPVQPLRIIAEEMLHLRFPEGTELFVAVGGELEVLALANVLAAGETILLLRDGMLVLDTPVTVRVSNSYGATAVIRGGRMGVKNFGRVFHFEAACFVGACRFAGDLEGELDLKAGESSFVGGTGRPLEPMAIDYGPYAAFASIVPTPTYTPTPTNTPTRTPTATPAPTRPPATATATSQPTSVPAPDQPSAPPGTAVPPTQTPPTLAPER
jgi:serine/threonine protein kinase